MPHTFQTATELPARPPLSMKFTKPKLREHTLNIFDKAIETKKLFEPVAFKAGEPQHFGTKF